MDRRYAYVALISGLLMTMWPLLSHGQVHQDTRHTETDRASAIASARSRVDALFDPAEAESLLELGSGRIHGVMGFRFSLRQSWKMDQLIPKKLTADRELVFLFPMTRYMQAWLDTYGHDSRLAAPGNLSMAAWRYRGQVLTDRDGSFTFNGLKPGRYLIFGSVPYSYNTYQRVDTGVRTFSYSAWMGSGSINPVYKTVSAGKASAVAPILAIIEVKDDQVTTYEPQVFGTFFKSHQGRGR